MSEHAVMYKDRLAAYLDTLDATDVAMVATDQGISPLPYGENMPALKRDLLEELHVRGSWEESLGSSTIVEVEPPVDFQAEEEQRGRGPS